MGTAQGSNSRPSRWCSDFYGKRYCAVLWKLEDRGKFFIGAQEGVYQGMIIGEHARETT
jgi:predicted membrane GTPase involved in stress response